jgi:hypothetical protein
VGLACVIGGNETPPPAAPTQPPAANTVAPQPTAVPPTEAPPPTEVPPTDAPQPTDVPAAADTPTTAPAAAEEFFTEEFDQDPGWNYFITYGDKNKAKVTFADSLMTFKLDATDIYAYYMYEGFKYRDVTVELKAENRGMNNNNVSLVCRRSDEGWYEFSTEGGGLWYLYAAIPGADGKIKYNRIDNGGAMPLHQGKEVNEYLMTCSGNEINLKINGKDIKTIKENKYALRSGYVGFNISSLNVTPIIVEVDWFKISKP